MADPPLDDDEIESYLRTDPATVLHEGDITNMLSVSAEELLVLTLASLAPNRPANLWTGGPWTGGLWTGGPWTGGPWTGGPWANPPGWALRGASLHSIIFRPDLYLPLEDDENYDPICKALKVLSEEELAKREVDRKEERAKLEAARFAEEEGLSQEMILACIKGRETRSTRRANQQGAVKGARVTKKQSRINTGRKLKNKCFFCFLFDVEISFCRIVKKESRPVFHKNDSTVSIIVCRASEVHAVSTVRGFQQIQS
jgi:hypothetical protein